MEIDYLNYKGEREVIRGVSHLQNIDNERFVALFNNGKERTLRIGRIEGIWHGEDEQGKAIAQQLEGLNDKLQAVLEGNPHE